MPSPLKERAVALCGLVLMAALCLQVLRGRLPLEAAALRAGVLVVLLIAVEQLVLPIARALVGAGARRPDDDAEHDPAAEAAGPAAPGEPPRRRRTDSADAAPASPPGDPNANPIRSAGPTIDEESR